MHDLEIFQTFAQSLKRPRSRDLERLRKCERSLEGSCGGLERFKKIEWVLERQPLQSLEKSQTESKEAVVMRQRDVQGTPAVTNEIRAYQASGPCATDRTT